MSWYFSYNAPLVEGQVSCAICEGRPSRASISGPIDVVPEIGSFVVDLDPQRVAGLRAAVLASRYADLPQSDAPSPPGTKFVSFGEGEGDRPPDPFRGFVFGAHPREIQPVIDRMSDLIAVLRRHPSAIVRARAEWGSPECHAGEPVMARIQFANPGTGPAELNDPAGAMAPSFASTTLAMCRDLPPEQLATDRDAHSVSILPADLQWSGSVPAPGASTGTVVIEAGGAAELQLHKTLKLPAGRYLGALTFRLAESNIAPLRRAAGTLVVPVGPITID